MSIEQANHAEPEVMVSQPATKMQLRLRAEVEALNDAYRFASALSKTQMVPREYQQSYIPKNEREPLGETAIQNLAAAIMYGMEIGLSAVQSAQNVFVVQGRPAVYARTMAGQVRQAGYVIEPVEESDDRCVWKALRDGAWAFSEWTMDMATKAGYTTNDMYRKNPRAMLRAKCIADVCRIKYQDILLGMAYTVEELQLEHQTMTRIEPASVVKGLAKLRELANNGNKKVVEAEAPPESGQEPEPEPEPEADAPAVGAQLAEIKKLYKARGFTAKDMLGDMAQYLCRDEPLRDFTELTYGEAADVIKYLTTPPSK